MRGQLLEAMKQESVLAATHPITVEDYKQTLRTYKLSNLQVIVLAQLMFDEQLPPFDHIIQGLINPVATVRKDLEGLQ